MQLPKRLIAFLAAFFCGVALDLFGKHFVWPWHLIDNPTKARGLFPPRAAFMQLGAMLGTIMTANVWMRILPPQRRMVAALKAGRQPDLAEGARAKMRSKHNTFIVLPVIFLMISHHYSIVGSPHNWLILSGMVLLGWGAAMVLRKA